MSGYWMLFYLFVSVAVSGICTVLFVAGGQTRNTGWAIWSTFMQGLVLWPGWILFDLSCCAADFVLGAPEDDDAD